MTEFRMYDPAIGRFWQIDPIIKENSSPYTWAMNNPIRYVDYLGLDTVDVNYNDDEIWEVSNLQYAKGDDVFRVTKDGETTSHTFSEGQYGERVSMLNLETSDEYTLGVYHTSGETLMGTGFYVTPGGDASTEIGSNARLPADTYDLAGSGAKAKWRQIWVTSGAAEGDVSGRGIKIHFAGSNAASWTQGCFVLCTSGAGYSKSGAKINFSFDDSNAALYWMNEHLGADEIFMYNMKKYNGRGRIGSTFKGIDHKLILKDAF